MERHWFLRGVAADGSHVAHGVGALPYRVGRDDGNELAPAPAGLSRRHAEIVVDLQGARRRIDLGSTDRTAVNHRRIAGSCPLVEHDFIHFGNAEFRLGCQQGQALLPQAAQASTQIVPVAMLSGHFVAHEREFIELPNGRGLDSAVQQVVHAAGAGRYAFDLLGARRAPRPPGAGVSCAVVRSGALLSLADPRRPVISPDSSPCGNCLPFRSALSCEPLPALMTRPQSRPGWLVEGADLNLLDLLASGVGDAR